MRKVEVRFGNTPAGELTEGDEGYSFRYLGSYLDSADARPVSLTLPLGEDIYESRTLFPFFDGLIPEGWLLQIARQNWKLDPRDRMGLLMACCRDCIGAVSIQPFEGGDE